MHAALFCSFHPGPFDHTSQAMADQYERSRAEMNTPAVVAAQSMFFTGPGRAKRGPPTPEMSGLTTPLGTDETMGQQEQIPTNPQVPPTQPLVQPVIWKITPLPKQPQPALDTISTTRPRFSSSSPSPSTPQATSSTLSSPTTRL